MKRADMLADMGYDAFAVDLFGKGNRPTDAAAKKEEKGRLYQDRERMRNLIVGGLQEARKASDEKAVVMGYCFGAAATLELARRSATGLTRGPIRLLGSCAELLQANNRSVHSTASSWGIASNGVPGIAVHSGMLLIASCASV